MNSSDLFWKVASAYILIPCGGILVIHWLFFLLTGVRSLSAMILGAVFGSCGLGIRVRPYYPLDTILGRSIYEDEFGVAKGSNGSFKWGGTFNQGQVGFGI